MNDGGPAFPVNSPCGHDPGMSLRDYFAAHALNGWLSNATATPVEAGLGPEASPNELADVAATFAYLVADAMLAERNKP